MNTPLRTTALLLLVFTFSGCSSSNLNFVPKSTSKDFIDFREYDSKGFLFTPFNYSGDYSMLRFLSVTTYAQASRPLPGNGISKEEALVWSIAPVRVAELVATLHRDAAVFGADAIIGFKVEEVMKEQFVGRPRGGDGTAPKTIFLPGYTVSGYAIKRNSREEIPIVLPRF
jgi:hypothetical protein